jgi:hypothetical protein
MIIPANTPPNAIPTETTPFISHPSLEAALGVVLELPALPEPEGEEEVGPETAEVGEGVKTPPEGSWAIHEEAADAAS